MDWHTVEGMFTDGDAKAYKECVEKAPEGGTIVEMGCWQGRSICSVAEIIKRKKLKVICIDMGETQWYDQYKPFPPHKLADIFKTNTQRFGLEIEYYKGTTVAAAAHYAEKGLKADVIMIDAGHAFQEVKGDIYSWWPMLKDGGVMCGHDFYMSTDMTVAVAFHPCFMGKKLNVHMTPVDGTGCMWSVVK